MCGSLSGLLQRAKVRAFSVTAHVGKCGMPPDRKVPFPVGPGAGHYGLVPRRSSGSATSGSGTTLHRAVVALIVGLFIAGCSSDKRAAQPPTTTASASSGVALGSVPTTESRLTATTGASSSASCSEYHAQITEADSGGEVKVGGETTRFSICLDEAKHPLSQLTIAGCPFGYVSNLSFAGPDSYPIGYEVTTAGSCIVRNGNYQVKVVTTG
jgi:hypothetical protein